MRTLRKMLVIIAVTLCADTAFGQAVADMSPVAIENGSVAINAKNSMIQFTGTHAGNEPNPRIGHFGDFAGELVVSDNVVQSVQVEIKTGSLQTPIGNLTDHLKSGDFFDVREHPTATFQSTSIEEGDGEVTINGDLTIMGESKAISIPATISTADGGMTLEAGITIDRTDFGMSKMTERVNKEVELKIVVGQTANNGGAGGGRGGRELDPTALFERRDADGDGKLTGDEIPEAMRSRLRRVDANGDGAVSKEELEARMKQFRSRRGRDRDDS